MIRILLVEDHNPDVKLTQRAFAKAKVSNTLDVARDGVECMAYLRKEGRFKDVLTPDLILLDLNMPRKDGRSVLKDMQADPVLAKIPVVVLTTSDADSDVETTYSLGANAYVVKPVRFEDFLAAISVLEDFWFCIVRLPK